jgi:hypothetical protein
VKKYVGGKEDRLGSRTFSSRHTIWLRGLGSYFSEPH